MGTRRVSRFVSVDVEVDMSDFSDEALLEELVERGYEIRGGPGVEDWQRLADAFRFNKDPERVLRELVYENTGRIIN